MENQRIAIKNDVADMKLFVPGSATQQHRASV
ncbi:hypothetical protein BN439_0661 [Erwinia amylovora Ea644]|uniref:Uncharacterized protein n=2 Tax=Erwinia amylovora TaxID=552 RepID=A0A830ZSW2_ERWAM|nr:hypothetical protein EaACW_0460 [Erwinia amylovora ACW56400]QJQ55822.1 hypothetical protein EHX00_3123 [Erwinia amylovora]CBA19404.1 hypothetical protein predicted by Glimmer/Critica [Erwinia amylovora CFBP1430]CBJ47643.1 hypothetical protein EAM_2969 [Erwinia amylovora ATCC 49946]CCO77304.1 hypothetical protein BN432_0472 [Erwinia amylovora Ea356]CCO81088.1 hypothetical protein BN433_0482 [Erwinia amylovora Ea266]CCO84893.1 hypothetical protein BN434_0471 [Erwinia amylovora CFBP 2585]CCO